MIILLAGCAVKQTRRYFWPPLPDVPKVEWIAQYAGQKDFPRTASQSLVDSVVGIEDLATFKKPQGITSNEAGLVYVTDTAGARVLVYDFINNKAHPLGEGETPFKIPVGVVLDGLGNIYISDSKQNKIFVYSKDERPLSVISHAELDWPGGMAIDTERGRLYVVNTHSHKIAVFDIAGNFLFSFGRRGDMNGSFNFPLDIDLDSEGNLVIADSMNARVQIMSPEGKFIRKFGHRGDSLTDFQVIKGVAVDKKTDNIYVTDGRAHRFLIFDKMGEALLTVGGVAMAGGPGAFMIPQDIFIEKSGRIYVVDSMIRRFQVFQIVDEDWLKKNPYN